MWGSPSSDLIWAEVPLWPTRKGPCLSLSPFYASFLADSYPSPPPYVDDKWQTDFGINIDAEDWSQIWSSTRSCSFIYDLEGAAAVVSCPCENREGSTALPLCVFPRLRSGWYLFMLDMPSGQGILCTLLRDFVHSVRYSPDPRSGLVSPEHEPAWSVFFSI